MNLLGVVLVTINQFAYNDDGVSLTHFDTMDQCKQEIRTLAFDAFDKGQQVDKAKDNTFARVGHEFLYTCELIKGS